MRAFFENLTEERLREAEHVVGSDDLVEDDGQVLI